jgi:hypothetical protein
MLQFTLKYLGFSSMILSTFYWNLCNIKWKVLWVYNKEWQGMARLPTNELGAMKKTLASFLSKIWTKLSLKTICVTIQLTNWVNHMNAAVSVFLFHYKQLLCQNVMLHYMAFFQTEFSRLQVGLCIWACHKSITHNLRANHYKSIHHITSLLLYS